MKKFIKLFILLLFISNCCFAQKTDCKRFPIIEYQSQDFDEEQFVPVKTRKRKKYYLLEDKETNNIYIYVGKKKKSPRRIPKFSSTAWRFWNPIISMNLKVKDGEFAFAVITDAMGNEWYFYRISDKGIYNYPIFYR